MQSTKRRAACCRDLTGSERTRVPTKPVSLETPNATTRLVSLNLNYAHNECCERLFRSADGDHV